MMLQYFRTLLILLTLSIASYFDFKYRKIHDYLWIPFTICGCSLLLYEYIYYNIDYNSIIFSIIISIVLSFILIKYKIIGEADGLALITTSILMPLFISDTVSIYFTGLTLMINSFCISLICPIFYLLFNCYQSITGTQLFSDFHHESNIRKIIMIFLGIKIKPNQYKFGIIVQKEINGILYFDFNSNIKIEDKLSYAKIWITPHIPLTIFMLLGFLFLNKYGDISYYLVNMII